MYGPGFANLNFSLAKTFSIPLKSELLKFQIRADAVDLFNHPNFGQPSTAVGLGVQGSGVIGSAIDSRTIQLGGVLRF